MLLEYFHGENNIYLFTISKERFEAHHIPIDNRLLYDMRSIISLVTNFAESFSNSSKNYLGSSQRLYEKLLMPIEPILPDSAELIIIPDGNLGLLPLEAFVKDSTQAIESTNSFLIQDYIFSYDHSATIHFGYPSLNLDKTGNKNSFIGFFPNNDLLPFVKHNKRVYATMINGEFWENERASKVRFLKEVKGFNGIIHLPTHGQMSPKYFYSSLAFSDDLLYSWEIFNLEINSPLVVLPACESGSGPIEISEGVMSLARAFSYAGCQAIITSLWKTNSNETLEIILPKFYEGLSKGYSKSMALRLAKLEYLNNSLDIDRHPYFWAALISVGNQKEIALNLKQGMDPERDRWVYGIIFSILILATLYWLKGQFSKNSL